MHVNQTVEGIHYAIVDLDNNVFETQVELHLISELKSLAKVIPNVIGQFAMELVYYILEPSYILPELIHWLASNYAVESRVVMNSNSSWVVCNINSQTSRQALRLPESNLQQSVSFNEENLISSFRKIENEVKLGFMLNLLKSNQAIEKLTFPYDLQDFKDCVKQFFSLLSQVLCLDNDKQVQEVMVSLAYSLS